MNCKESFLQIVRLGIGHHAGRISGEIDWSEIQALDEQQGLSAIVVDDVEKLPQKVTSSQNCTTALYR